MSRSPSVALSQGESAAVNQRLLRFLDRQIKELRSGGKAVLLRKGHIFLMTLVAAPAIAVVWALRPLILIRFGSLRSERIGHFAGNTELYLCERDASMHRRRTFDVFYYNQPISNHQLKKMWDRILHVCQLAKWLDHLNRKLPGGQKHVIPIPSDKDIHGLLSSVQTHLSFTPGEECRGQKALRELGIPEGSPFICIYARDSAYLQAMFPDTDCEYHNYRDSSIHSHIPAAEEMGRRGYYTIRVGAIVKEPLITNHPMIIDYATTGRTDFLDVYLGAKCHFFLGSTGGIYEIPRIFRKPMALANFIPVGEDHLLNCTPSCLFIPKKLWLRDEHRFLTFRETLNSGAGKFFKSEQYAKLGVEVIENTPEEITAIAVEMDERLKETWQTSEEDEELQRRFWTFFEPTEPRSIALHIGTDFLRQNQKLLD